MVQSHFAGIILQEEEQTLLDLTSLDQGFYFAAGILPNCRYFVDNNLNTQEKADAIAGYIAEGRTKFIVTADGADRLGENYALAATEDGMFDLAVERQYRLFVRLEEGDGSRTNREGDANDGYDR